MLVPMERSVFESLDSPALGQACVAPFIAQIRGQDVAIKSQVYAQLGPGQRALLMFWVFFGHARPGVRHFYAAIAYLLPHVDLWTAIKTGLGFFQDHAMLELVREIEAHYHVLAACRPTESHWYTVDSEVAPDLLAVENELDAKLQMIAPATMERIGRYIRSNPSQFVELVD